MTSYTRGDIAAAVLIVSFVTARSTYSQDGTTIADQVTIVPVSPIEFFPIPPGTVFERDVVFGEGADVTAGATEQLIYSNTLGTFGAALGAGKLVADDITTTVPGGCKLVRYEFPVVGKVNPAGTGGSYTVDFAMYTSCPGSVPAANRPLLIIPGTQGQRTFTDQCQNATDDDGDTVVNDGCPAVGPAETDAQCLNAMDDDGDGKVNDGCPAVGDPETDNGSVSGPRLISFVAQPNISLETNMWFGVKFSRNNAGVVMGAPPMTGFSCDQFDYPGLPCDADAGGFPEYPHASFNLQIFADSACANSYTGYKNNKPSGPTYNPGADVFLADDIQLSASGCNMIAYEVAVRGQGFYTFKMQNNCESGLIAGTEQTFILTGTADARIARFTFDPPIALPQNLSFQTKVNITGGSVVIAGQQACIGSTADRLDTVVNNVCTQVDPYDLGLGIYGAVNLTITCAGAAPVGACCDMYITDPAGDAVCREVPLTNCPFPPRFTTDQPAWVEGASCEPDPFPFPCGVAACCILDWGCEDVTETQCDKKGSHWPHEWQIGEYCASPTQQCTFGDCLITRTNPGCWSQECEQLACAFDAWCCEVEWDLLCVRHAQVLCNETRLNSTCAPSSSDDYDGAYELPANSTIQYAGRGEWLDGSGTGFSCYPVGLKHCYSYPYLPCDTDTDCDGGTCIPITPIYQGYYPAWFQFTATSDSARVHTCTTSPPGLDMIVEVFAAADHSTPETTCSTLQSLGCNDNAEGCNGGVGADLCVTGLSPGELYLVKVAGVKSNDVGVIELTIESPCPTAAVAAPESAVVKPAHMDAIVRKLDANGTTPYLRRPKLEPTTPPIEPARLHREFPDDSWAPRTVAPPAGVVQHCGPWVWDEFESIQVNVDANGCNIVGDAANEPSIAVDPTNPNRIVIGWRQFDSVLSNFRKAGWGYSHNAGQTWTFPGTLDNGEWRSDPVLGAGPDGTIFYYSINSSYAGTLFASFDGGVTWPRAQSAYGDDKPWMAIDQTAGIGRGNIYVTWSIGQFTRSIDGGLTFSYPRNVPGSPYWGTMTVDPLGSVFIAGQGVVVRSTNAKDPNATVTFDSPVPAPAWTRFGDSDTNPGGLIGQPWIAADHSGGPRHGHLYLLTPTALFSRSTDEGLTWSDPIAVNTSTWPWAHPWFGIMSVAPNGRIDAAWNDVAVGCDRAGSCYRLFYTFSNDGGDTWSDPVAVSPPFDSTIGWPNQNKIGDYYHMISDDNGVNVAYAATFNGEQDVYFLRIGPPPDCNHNGLPDRDDVLTGRSDDCDHNFVPDECQSDFDGDGVIDTCDDDIDNDGVPNFADVCDHTGLGSPVAPNGRPLSDTTGQCNVGLPDYWRFRNCMVNGRLGFPAPAEACHSFFDYDGDGNINLRDFAGLQNAFRSSGW